MLFCCGLFALLLYNTVVANAVCSFTYSKEDRIEVLSRQYEALGYARCLFTIKAPTNTWIQLNFTDLLGFQPATGLVRSPDPNLNNLEYKSSLSSLSSSSSSSSSSSLLSLSSSTPKGLSSLSPSLSVRPVLSKASLQQQGNSHDSLSSSSSLPSPRLLSSNDSDNVTSSLQCLPPDLVIRVASRNGTRSTQNSVCSSQGFSSPQVFQFDSSLLQIVYKWTHGHTTGFSLEIDFHNKSNCAFICDQFATCLKSESQICDSIVDCTDNSDEKNCSYLPASPNTTDNKIPVLTLVLSLASLSVFMVGVAVVLCLTYQATSSSSRMLRRLRGRDRAGVDHRQLRPHSQGSEVVSLPSSSTVSSSTTSSSTSSHGENKMALLEQRHLSMQSMPRDTTGFPPRICRQDGEEGYHESQQRLLHHPKHEIYQPFRPPPNRTVFDKDSPPPYYACAPPNVTCVGLDMDQTVPFPTSGGGQGSHGRVANFSGANDMISSEQFYTENGSAVGRSGHSQSTQSATAGQKSSSSLRVHPLLGPPSPANTRNNRSVNNNNNNNNENSFSTTTTTSTGQETQIPQMRPPQSGLRITGSAREVNRNNVYSDRHSSDERPPDYLTVMSQVQGSARVSNMAPLNNV